MGKHRAWEHAEREAGQRKILDLGHEEESHSRKRLAAQMSSFLREESGVNE